MHAKGKIIYCAAEMDAKFQKAVLTQATPGPRKLKVVYSPLHGVGATAVLPVLAEDGFTDVELFGPHATPDGDFPNVPGHVANPENPAVFDAIIEHARSKGADVALATDPDCDRIGAAAPLKLSSGSPWHTFTGNQLCALLADFVLESRREAGNLTPQNFIVETLVTTQLVRRIGDSYGVRTIGDLLVGFKWIAKAIDDFGPEFFVYGTEESHGFMAGTYARDKDGAVASLLLCELAAKLKAAGRTLHEKLDSLFWQHGVHVERTVSIQMPGSEGMQRMVEVMAAFRAAPPKEVGGDRVVQIRDYERQSVIRFDESGAPSEPQPLAGPKGDLVFLDLATEGNYVACRPSGTEPKIKFYMFTYKAPEQLSNLESATAELEERLTRMETSLRKFAGV
jgi:phosphoglucomutase/phosphomannomutase